MRSTRIARAHFIHTPKPEQPVPATPKPTKAQEKQARQLEAEIEAAETELARLEEELADPSAWNDPRSAEKSTRKHAEAKARVELLYEQLEAVAG